MNGVTFRLCVLAASIAAVPILAHSQSQYPGADQLANKVIAKYQNMSCDQLAAQKQQQPSGQKAEMEQRAMQKLKSDPQMRAYFINKVAGPIANKMFDCGMIP